MLENVSSIVRRRPNDPLSNQSEEASPYPLSTMQGICKELQEIFQIATSLDVPFNPINENEIEISSIRSMEIPRNDAQVNAFSFFLVVGICFIFYRVVIFHYLQRPQMLPLLQLIQSM